MPEHTLVLATRNAGKVREIRSALTGLNVEVLSLEQFPGVSEPDEHGSSFAENARDKALYYARATGRWAMADDSGLVVDALGGQLGVYSARYAADDCPPGADRRTIDQANNRKLLAALDGVPDACRTARFVCHVALAEPGAILLEAGGVVEGRIARAPAGENGFGYDPLFFVPELARTTAQLSTDQKNRISHRGKAVREFAEKLREYLRTTPGRDQGSQGS